MRRTLGVVAALLLGLVLFVSVPAAARADGKWLDSDTPANWNAPGMGIPDATPPEGPLDPRVTARERAPETPEDRALVAKGWRLFAGYEAGWGVKVIQATSTYDGMGRPWQYQAFVFMNGIFAGTLSPEPMNSRFDGALDSVSLFGSPSVVAEFRRYSPTDPLCCPSGSATVSYRVDQNAAGPVVVPAFVSRQTPAGATAPAPPAPTPVPGFARPSGDPSAAAAARQALSGRGQ